MSQCSRQSAKAFPGRAAIILKLLNLSNKTIKCVYEKNNSPKINNYVPGTIIPIISEKILFKENSKIPIINLAWHIPEEIKNYYECMHIRRWINQLSSC